MATQGTVLSGFYRRAFERVGFVPLEPSAQTQRRNVDRAIFLAKAGRIVEARSLGRAAADELFERGVSRNELAWRELPLALAPAARKNTRLHSSHTCANRMPLSA